MVITYGERTIKPGPDKGSYVCTIDGSVVMVTDRRQALQWLYEGQPYEFSTHTTTDGYVGIVKSKADGSVLSRVYVRWEEDTPLARNEAWARVNDWARKYGIEV